MDGITRGSIYLIDFGENQEGSIQGGIRPGVILQNDTGNKFSTTTIVIPISSKSFSNLPMHVQLRSIDFIEGELLHKSIVLTEQVRVINSSSIIKKIGTIKGSKMNLIEDALMLSLGLTVKLNKEVFL
ncbi:type II toxin-antitoxin system PemK/MazF family toxin [Psychrobacillus sp. FSL H8-0487]|uniref:type II toxin-antitoxin system PemK/MazF family toxin n=1 Tax=Psychrobacillus sp. FSL H8-0487 TaxID=2921391 RepID=UPI0030F955FF